MAASVPLNSFFIYMPDQITLVKILALFFLCFFILLCIVFLYSQQACMKNQGTDPKDYTNAHCILPTFTLVIKIQIV